MANIILFYSASILGFLQIIGAFGVRGVCGIFKTNILVGVVASVINHGMTSRYTSMVNRAAMVVCAGVDVFVATCYSRKSLTTFTLLFAAVSLYLFSKFLRKTSVHVLSHISLTALHLSLIGEMYASHLKDQRMSTDIDHAIGTN